MCIHETKRNYEIIQSVTTNQAEQPQRQKQVSVAGYDAGARVFFAAQAHHLRCGSSQSSAGWQSANNEPTTSRISSDNDIEAISSRHRVMLLLVSTVSYGKSTLTLLID